MKGFFGDVFDFNGDGELDAMEQAADLGLFMEIEKNSEESDELIELGDMDDDIF